jgi:hypothetical protein
MATGAPTGVGVVGAAPELCSASSKEKVVEDDVEAGTGGVAATTKGK